MTNTSGKSRGELVARRPWNVGEGCIGSLQGLRVSEEMVDRRDGRALSGGV